jgi:hypothetical protein
MSNEEQKIQNSSLLQTDKRQINLPSPFPSPHWGEGGGEGVKSVRRKFSDLLGKNLKLRF